MRRLIDMSQSRGLGDSLVAVQMAKGLANKYPDDEIIVRTTGENQPWCQIWHHEVTNARMMIRSPIDRTYTPYASYDAELKTKSAKTRHELYSEACEGCAPVLTPPCDIRADPAYQEHVLLAPYSNHAGRLWPISCWLILEDMLLQDGHKVTVVARELAGIKKFQSPKMHDLTPPAAVQLVLSCRLCLALDSAIAHIAGMVDTPAIVLCGPTVGRKVFPYPSCTCIQGRLPCDGCYWAEQVFPRVLLHVLCLSCLNQP